MRRPRPGRRLIAWVLVIAAFVAVVAALRTQAAWDEACSVARRSLPALLGMEVGIGRCELDPLTGAVRLYGISAYPPGANAPLWAIDSAEVEIGAVQPLFGSVELSRIRVIRPRVNLDLSPPKVPQPPRPCPLKALQRVKIGRMDVEGGEVRIALPKGREIEVLGINGTWRTREGVAEIEVQGSGGSFTPAAAGRPLVLSRLVASGALDVDGESLEISRGEADLDDVSLSASGKIEELCDPRLMLDVEGFLPLPRLSRALGILPLRGHAWARVVASGAARDPTLAFDVVGTGVELDRYHLGEVTAQLALRGSELKLGSLVVGAGPGEVRVSGGLSLKDPYPLALEVSAQGAEAARVIEKVGLPRSWVDFHATGSASLAGQLRPFSLEGQMDMAVSGFRLATRAFDAPETTGRRLLQFKQGRVLGVVRAFQDRLEFADVSVSSGKSLVHADAVVHFDPKLGLSVRAASSALDLSDFGKIAQISAAGKGEVQVEVRGPYNDISAEATLALHDFAFWDLSLGVVQGKVGYRGGVLSFPSVSGQRGKTQYFGGAELDFRHKGMEVKSRFDFKGASPLPGTALAKAGPLEPRAQDLVDIIVGLHSAIELFQGPLEGEIPGATVTIQGPSESFHGDIRVPLRDLTYYGRRLGDGEIALRFEDGNSLVLDDFELSGPVGRLHAQGKWLFDGPFERFGFTGNALSLGEIVDPEGAKKLGISGAMELEGTVTGSTETTPVVQARLVSDSVQYRSRPLGRMHLEATLRGRELEVSGNPFRSSPGASASCEATLGLTMRLRDPVPYTGTLALDLRDLTPFLPPQAAAQGFSGALSGSVAAEGDAKDLHATRLSAHFDRLQLTRGEFRAENEAPVAWTYAGGKLELEAMTLRGPSTQITAEGFAGPERMDFKARGTMDLRLFEPFVPKVERTGGTLELMVAATGPVERPSLVGSARLRDAKLALRDYPLAFRALSGNVEFSDQTLLLEGMDGTLNDGRLRAFGSVRLDGPLDEPVVRAMGLTVALEDVYFRAGENIPLTLEGALQLTKADDAQGRPRSALAALPALGGDVTISRIRYEKELALDELIRELVRSRSAAPSSTGEKPEPSLRFSDLAIRLAEPQDGSLGRAVRMDNNLAKAVFRGEVTLTGTNVNPGLLGHVETVEKSQPVAFFHGNRLSIKQGLIQFRGRDSIDSEIDLTAETQVGDYQVKIHAFGPTAKPEVLLTSEPSLSDADILRLLTLGDRSDSATAMTYMAGEALIAATGLDRQVQRYFPKNPVLINPSVHITTGLNEQSGQVEPLASLEARLLTQQLKVGMMRPFSGRGTRVTFEYQFDNGFSTQAQWDENSEANSPFGNVGLDFKYRWESNE